MLAPSVEEAEVFVATASSGVELECLLFVLRAREYLLRGDYCLLLDVVIIELDRGEVTDGPQLGEVRFGLSVVVHSALRHDLVGCLGEEFISVLAVLFGFGDSYASV